MLIKQTKADISPPNLPKPQHAAFVFGEWQVNKNSLEFHYQLIGGADQDISFCEKISFQHAADRNLPTINLQQLRGDPIFDQLCTACHLVFGLSYYKAALPEQIVCPPLTPSAAEFFDILYSEGLGEFYFRNNLAIPQRQLFPRHAHSEQNGNLLSSLATSNLSKTKQQNILAEKALVLIGGGKDSALVSEIVNKTNVPASALSLGRSIWAERSAAAANLPLHSISRQIDPQLFVLNQRGAWNGHIPISACIAAISTLFAYCYGYSVVLAGNERGAEEATVCVEGVAYNHQWSKTFRFERMWQKFCEQITSSDSLPRYFSLLRPLSEINIASAFAKLPEHLANFTSCNANFKQNSSPTMRWCGKCPKCVFVYLLLAPFLTRGQRNEVFADNFLHDNYQHLLDLLGVNPIKPWECVGTIEECRLALTALSRQEELPADLQNIIAKWPEVLLQEEFTNLWNNAFVLSDQHALPPQWEQRLNEYLRIS